MYVDARYASSLMRIRREVRIPENAIGSFDVIVGQSVDIRTRIGRAIVPARHVIIEAASILGLRDPNALANMLLVKPNQIVSRQTPLAGRDPKRGKRVFAPSDGLIVSLDRGSIIFQERPELIDLEAGVRGTITLVTDRKVYVETVGSLVTGVWGNGRSVIATLRMEPSNGIDQLPTETLDPAFKGEIVISTRPLTAQSFHVMSARGFAGVIAPSMPAELLPLAENEPRAIMLTEGFGVPRMNSGALDLLKEMDGFLATLNANKPSRAHLLRPELVVNRGSVDQSLRAPNVYEPLKVNARVRVTREPHQGQVGKVLELPKLPQRFESGLRAPAARLLLLNTNEQVVVPLANLELIGG
ncbi:MAG: hypothetical protein SNJ54_10260 [Anaerolineae bacterium]